MRRTIRETLLSARDVLFTAGPFIVLALLLLAGAYYLLKPAPPKRVVLATGSEQGAYAAFGHRVIADEIPGFAGPLAGFERGLAHARGELVATVPCDSPFLPADLVSRLRLLEDPAGVAAPKQQPTTPGHEVEVACTQDELTALLVP